MPRRGRGPGRPRALVAAAKKVDLTDKTVKGPRAQPWQDDAWGVLDSVGEVKQLVKWRGNQLAKIRLYIATMPPDSDPDDEPVAAADPDSGIPPAVAAAAEAELATFRSNLGGQAAIIRRLEENLEVVGECFAVYLAEREVREPDPDKPNDAGSPAEPADWIICSVSEVEKKNRKWLVKRHPNDQKGRELSKEAGDDIFRVWEPHTRWGDVADCSMRAVLPECESLGILSNQVMAEARSRAAAGILCIPNELSFGPADPADPEDGDDADEDPFVEELTKALTNPVRDPSDVSSVVPLILRGPKDALAADVLRLLTLSRWSDETLDSRIDKRVDRLARSLDAPPEVMKGHQGTTFANADQIDEDTFEDYLAPRAEFICDAIDAGFLRERLANIATPEVAERLFVWYDPSRLVKQPDQEKNADSAFDRLQINGQAYRRAKGYDEADAPEPLEMLVNLATRRGAVGPEMTAALLETVASAEGVDLLTPPAAGEVAASRLEVIARVLLLADQQARANVMGRALDEAGVDLATLPGVVELSAPGPATDVGRRLVGIDRELRARLLVLANDAMTRALQRAGARLGGRRGRAADLLRGVRPEMAAATLGRATFAELGFDEEELLSGSFDSMEEQFMAWGAGAQREALDAVARLVGMAPAQRDQVARRQADDLAGAWAWMRDALGSLARERLFDPDPAAGQGEFDPSLRVPPGLVRQAISRAGGAQGLQTGGEGDAWVTLRPGGEPAGGVGFGETIRAAYGEAGGQVDGFAWDYGPAHRSRPFHPHLRLDGRAFGNFDDAILVNPASWPPFGHYLPGDHDGCLCDFVPSLVPPAGQGAT